MGSGVLDRGRVESAFLIRHRYERDEDAAREAGIGGAIHYRLEGKGRRLVVEVLVGTTAGAGHVDAASSVRGHTGGGGREPSRGPGMARHRGDPHDEQGYDGRRHDDPGDDPPLPEPTEPGTRWRGRGARRGGYLGR
jgi:hypothetical protein